VSIEQQPEFGISFVTTASGETIHLCFCSIHHLYDAPVAEPACLNDMYVQEEGCALLAAQTLKL
jgi:hypothetical protein